MNNNNDMIQPISFIDYNKIQDNLVYFSKVYSLKFNVVLKRRDKNGNWISNFNEYGYKYSDSNELQYVIKRNISYYYSIDSKENYENGVMITVRDIEPLKMLIDNQIMPWFIGPNRIFNKVKNKLVISGKFENAEFPISESKYLIFYPIVLDFEDGKSIEGIRIEINTPENYIDISVSKFMEFIYYIKNVDMYNAACNMITYVKTPPYLQNYNEFGDELTVSNHYSKSRQPVKNFFDNM